MAGCRRSGRPIPIAATSPHPATRHAPPAHLRENFHRTCTRAVDDAMRHRTHAADNRGATDTMAKRYMHASSKHTSRSLPAKSRLTSSAASGLTRTRTRHINQPRQYPFPPQVNAMTALRTQVDRREFAVRRACVRIEPSTCALQHRKKMLGEPSAELEIGAIRERRLHKGSSNRRMAPIAIRRDNAPEL